MQTSNDGDPILRRSTFLAYPEVGCSADDLPTDFHSQDFHLSLSSLSPPSSSLIGTTCSDFLLPPLSTFPNQPVVSINTNFLFNHHKERLRLTLELLPKSKRFASEKVILAKEQKTSKLQQSEFNEMADAKRIDPCRKVGLSSAVLSNLLAGTKNFADATRPTLLRNLRGSWVRYFAEPTPTATGVEPFNLVRVGNLQVSDSQYADALRLPGGITVRSSTNRQNMFELEISLTEELTTKEDEYRSFRKVVVNRVYNEDGKRVKVQYWVEEKKIKKK